MATKTKMKCKGSYKPMYSTKKTESEKKDTKSYGK